MDWRPLIVAIVSASVGSLLTYWLTTTAPHLRVIIPETIAFQGDKAQLGIINIGITSDGSKEAENVECRLELKASRILDVKTVPERSGSTIKFDDHHVLVSVPDLIPPENLLVSILATNPDGIPKQVNPSVRAKGVVGVAEAPPQNYSFGIVILSFGIGFILGLALSRRPPAQARA